MLLMNRATGYCEDCGERHPGKMSPKQVAEHFNVTDRTIRNWCDKQILASAKAGGVIRIKRIDVLNFEVPL